VEGLEILVPSDEIVGRRFRGKQIKEWAITLVADGGAGGNGVYKLGFGTDGGQEVFHIHASTGKRRLEFGTVHNGRPPSTRPSRRF
jgi:hypothetical protein